MKKSEAWDIQSLAAGDYYATFKYAISVSEAWIANAADGRDPLDFRTYTLEQLRAEYNEPIAEITRGTPIYAAWNVIRLAPGSSTTLPTTGDTADIVLKSADEAILDGILFYPPADVAYTLRIKGVFYTQPLSTSDGETKSFWSENHEDALVAATLYRIEKLNNRNRAAAKVYLDEMNETVHGLLQGSAMIKFLGGGNRLRR